MTTVTRMPPIPAPPHDPTSLLLAGWLGRNAAEGFRGRVFDQIEVSRDCRTLSLAPAPGATRLLVEPSGSFGGLRSPLNVARSADGSIYLLDPATGHLLRFDECACRFVTVPCFTRVVPGVSMHDARSGRPVGARPVARTALCEPHGIAIRHGDLYVADSAHGRVVSFALQGFIPRAELRLPPSVAATRAQGWYPFALAFASDGRLYVSDPRAACVDEFDAQGRWRRTLPVPAPPWALLCDAADRLHALLATADGLEVSSGDAATWTWRTIPAVALDAHVVRFVDGVAQRIDARAEIAPGCATAQLDVDAAGVISLPCATNDDAFDARGRPLPRDRRRARARFQRAGRFESVALDARIEGCQWHRVELRGALPEGCRVSVRTTTAHVELDADEVAALPDSAWSAAHVATRFDAGADDARWDCLVTSAPGRYLWLRLELDGDGQDSPRLCAIVVEFPRVSLRRYLPAVFGADEQGAEFTDRFTAIFDATLRSTELRIDRLAMLFDPASAPARRGPHGEPDFLAWIASWIGITPVRDLPLERQRRFVKYAARLYGRRGTPRGLRDQLLLLLGFDVRLEECLDERPRQRCLSAPRNCGPAPERTRAAAPPLILEHFRLRRWLFAGQGRLGSDAVLWGRSIVNRSQLSGDVSGVDRSGNARIGATQLKTVPDALRDPLHVHAHRFSVFVPARVRADGAERRAFEQLLAQETPAHAACDVHYVEPRFRVGRQATIGLDSVIARTPAGVRLDANSLGQGTILTARPGTHPGPSVRVGDTRVGTTTRLT